MDTQGEAARVYLASWRIRLDSVLLGCWRDTKARPPRPCPLGAEESKFWSLLCYPGPFSPRKGKLHTNPSSWEPAAPAWL